MANFLIQGLTIEGQLVQRSLIAHSTEEAVRLAQHEGLHVISSEAQGNSLSWSFAKPRFDLTLFTHELMALLSAGLSLIEALETLAERQGAAQEHLVLQELIRAMYEGLSFSQALAQFPAIFPQLFVATVSASEQTGEIIDALGRYLRYQAQVGLIRQKIISAGLYPALLLTVGLAVGLFLLCYLVPRFSHVYENLDTELPLASRLLMQWGMFASQHTLAVTLGIVGSLGFLVVMVKRPEVQQAFLRLLYKNRWLGQQLQLMQLSRFYRSLSLLLRGGIPVIKGLQMTESLLPDSMRPQLQAAISTVSAGQSLSYGLQQAQLTTAVALRLLRAGERNGQVAEMLEQIASFHEHEVGRWIDGFTRLFEPLLMLFIGLLIGGIVILLYLPIFELASSVQ